MFNYVVTAHRPSKVTHTAVGSFLGPRVRNLLVAKIHSIEVFSITPTGLVCAVELPIYGRIQSMKLFRPPKSPQDHLMLLTAKRKLIVISWSPVSEQCVTITLADVQDPMINPIERSPITLVDPSSQVIAVYQYKNLLKIVPTDYNQEAFNLRLPESTILDIALLHNYPKPTIAVLSRDAVDAVHLKTYQILMRESDLLEGILRKSNLDRTANRLVAVPKPCGGLIVIGGQSIMYFNESENFHSIPIEPTAVLAVGMIDEDGSRYLLSDNKGILTMLVLEMSTGEVTNLSYEKLGETSIASTISYLDNGFVFIGSKYGDSQLVRLSSDRNPETGNFTEIIHSYSNLGPIVDFCFVNGPDHAHQGQGQIVTCSGMNKDGSLRVVRNGIGISEQALVDLPGIKEMFSLRRRFADSYDTYLVQSFTHETRILAMVSSDEMEEARISGFDAHSPTLCAGNMIGDLIIQVTADGIYAVDCTNDGEAKERAWSPPSTSRVSVATSNTHQILVGTTGGNLYYFEVDSARRSLVQKSHAHLDCEIACLDCSKLASDEGGLAKLACIGLWAKVGSKPTVNLIELPTLRVLKDESLEGDIMARDVLLASLGSMDYMLTALGDGHLLVYRINRKAFSNEPILSTDVLTDRRKIAIGTQPASLCLFRSRGQNHAFAACDRPTVIYSAAGSGKILVSNVNLREVRRVCAFHSEAFPDCLAISTEHNFQLGAIDGVQKLHIHTIPLGESPRRIVHLEKEKCFAVVTQGSFIDETGDESEQSFVKLIGDTTYENTDAFKLDPFEYGCSLAVTPCQGGFANGALGKSYGKISAGEQETDNFSSEDILCVDERDSLEMGRVRKRREEPADYLVVGTTFIYPQEEESSSGRILVFKVVDGKFVQVCTKMVRGTVYSLASLRGKILAGVNDCVQLFSLGREKDGSYYLKEDLSQAGRVMVLFIRTRGDFVFVGDLLRSVSLLKYGVDSTGEKLEELARDYDAMWPTALEILGDDIFVVAENSMNLFTYKRDSYSALESERTQLKRVGTFHLGSLVNRILKGTLVTTVPESESPALQSLIFVTADGMVGVIASLREENFNFLQKLQRAMTSKISGVGGLDHSAWREMVIEDPPQMVGSAKNYIDGDLIERFLDLSTKLRESVAAEVDVPVSELMRLVEELQRLH